ncbi:Hypothetical protein NTJ_09752 [Nesidiocoris tenuis]|uniref:Pupal cuticle protein n=1 Tax=Nesidiocoris tenuis TaxID=355587 RepID=A0ABN7AXM6_9HEMI|nr:Hypothetical protein NTJ_09752 [Nesidiocoris tenuis]
MRVAVFVACMIGAAVAYPWGIPQQVHETPEVAAAKAAHLAAHAKAHYTASPSSWSPQERSWDEHDDGSYKDDQSWKQYDDGSYRPEHHNHQDDHQDDHHNSWSGPGSNGASHGHWDNHEKKWTGPVALPPGYDKNGAPLQVHDTPEVEAAKSKFFHQYHHAAAHASHSPSWGPQY